MYTYMSLTKYFKPYYSEMLNKLEIYSTLATLSTMVLGIFYVQKYDSSKSYTLTFVFIILVLINSAYLIYWSLKISPYIINLFLSTLRYY
jgi:hypothetical protein